MFGSFEDSISNTCVLVYFQASIYSIVIKILISISTVILLTMILAYHALEVQVSVDIV